MHECSRALTIASYNVHGCIGLDGRNDPARIANVIRELKTSIVGLQEIYFGTTEKEDDCQMRQLAELTGMEAVAGPTRIHGSQKYGNMLLTTLPIVQSKLIDLSVTGREPRGAISATIITETVEIEVVVTHLGLKAPERRDQIRKLLVASDLPRPTIIVGDLNEWIPMSRSMRWLYKHFGKSPAPRTFPSYLPLLSLDRIWSFPQNTLLASSAHRSRLARIASDHLPVIGKICIQQCDEFSADRAAG